MKIAVFDSEKCTGCAKCADVCDFINVPESGIASTDKDLCSGCGDCVSECDAQAITVKEKE